MKEEALDRVVWTARFGRGFGPVVRQTAKLINEYSVIQSSRVRFPALPDFLSSRVGLERGPLSLVRSIEELLE